MSCRGVTYDFVSQLGEPLGGCDEELTLVHAAHLRINTEMLLIENLQDGVKQATQWRICRLFNNFGTRLLRIVLTDQTCHCVHIHNVLGALLVTGSQHELELVNRCTNSPQDRADDEAVVGCAVFDELDRSLEVVEEAMNVGEEDGDMAAGGEELGDFDGGGEVAAVRAAGGGSAPVDTGLAAFGKGSLDDLWVEELSEVLADEGETFFVRFGGHGGRFGSGEALPW